MLVLPKAEIVRIEEVNLGFNGETGLPFVAKAQTNASVKVSAKWKKGA